MKKIIKHKYSFKEIKNFLLNNKGTNIYKLLSIALFLFFALNISKISELASIDDSRLLAMHSACNNSSCCPAMLGSCGFTVGNTSIASCTLASSPSCDTTTGLCAGCTYESNSGSCSLAPNAGNGWQVAACNASQNQIGYQSVTCKFSASTASVTASYYQCETKQPCACSPSCTVYTATGATCTNNICPITLTAGSCQTCQNNGANSPGTLVASAPVAGANATCGSSAGGTAKCSAPTTNLCGNGALPTVTQNGGSFTWTCPGSAGSCGGATGLSIGCSTPYLAPVNGVLTVTGSCSVSCGVGTMPTNCSAANACGVQICPVVGVGTSGCDMGCCPVNGANGQGNMTTVNTPQSSAPSGAANLCTVGTPSAVTANYDVYSWSCAGLPGTCGGSTGYTTFYETTHVGACRNDACCTTNLCGYKPNAPNGCDPVSCYELDGFSKCKGIVSPDGSCTYTGRVCVGR